MKYNYVIFNSVSTDVNYNLDEDYYVICLKDLENREDVILNHVPLQSCSKFWRRTYNFFHSRWFKNKYWDISLDFIWYPYIFKNTFKDDKPICFICLRYPPIGYLRYLRKQHPNCKIVKMSRDVIKIQVKRHKDYSEAGVFDLWMSFDEEDCKKYGFSHFDEFESKIDIPKMKNYPIADVFFAGKAKDRLERLVKLYDKFEENGLNCFFYITEAKENEKIQRKGIVYATKPMSYVEMLNNSVNSRIILEVSQENAVGYTSRFLEAVLFNKLLITDNDYIGTTKFYNPRYIQIIKSEKDIDVSIIDNSEVVDYDYSGEFSPLNRLVFVDKLLSK